MKFQFFLYIVLFFVSPLSAICTITFISVEEGEKKLLALLCVFRFLSLHVLHVKFKPPKHLPLLALLTNWHNDKVSKKVVNKPYSSLNNVTEITWKEFIFPFFFF